MKIHCILDQVSCLNYLIPQYKIKIKIQWRSNACKVAELAEIDFHRTSTETRSVS